MLLRWHWHGTSLVGRLGYNENLARDPCGWFQWTLAVVGWSAFTSYSAVFDMVCGEAMTSLGSTIQLLTVWPLGLSWSVLIFQCLRLTCLQRCGSAYHAESIDCRF